MKKYETPLLEEEKVEIEDVIAASAVFGSDAPGDVEFEWPWSRK